MATTGYPRIEVGYRVGQHNDSFDVELFSAGIQAVVHLTPGLYLSLNELVAEIQTQCNAAGGAWTVSVGADGRVTFAVSGDTMEVSWTRSYSLRDWLGFTGAATPNGASATGAHPCPGYYRASVPWPRTERPGWTHAVRQWRGRHGRGRDRGIGRLEHYDVEALIVADDMAQWRSVLPLMLAGLPATYYRGVEVNADWDIDYPYDCRSRVVLDPASVEEIQLAPQLDDYVQARFRLVKYTGSAPVVTDFDPATQCPELGLRFVLAIQGIPYLFLDGEAVVDQLDQAWSAPGTKASRSYTLLPHTLDTSGGIRDVGPEISRRTSEVSPSSMRLTLADEAPTVRLAEVFATDRDGGKVATLTDNLEYDTAGVGAAVDVDSTTGWPSSGLAYLGRETLYYPAVSANTLGTGANKATRDLLNDPALVNGTTYGDLEYLHRPDRPSGPRVIADYPRVWHGRWVSLRAIVVDPFGRALGTSYGGAYTSEIWRGVIRGTPRPSDDWHSWVIETDSIDAALSTEVGIEVPRGTLMRLPGGKVANETGALNTGDYPSPEAVPAHFVQSGANHISITIAEWADGDWHGTLTGQVELDVSITAGVYSRDGLVAAVNAALDTALAAAVTATDLTAAPVLTLRYDAATAQYVLRGEKAAGYLHQINVNWAAADSIGPMLGFDAMTLNDTLSTLGFATGAPYAEMAHYLSPTATGILYYPAPDEGLGTSAPSSGYARIGSKDEGEIVRYTSITSKTSIFPGLYQLDVAERGALGTAARELRVYWDEGWKASADRVEVVFGIGIDGTHPIEAIAQLAVSTGGGHHGDYDVHGYRTAAALDPQHLDLSDLANAVASMPAPPIRLFLSEPVDLAELASDLLRPYGRHLYARRRGGRYRIGVGWALPPLESATATAIGSSALDLYEPAQHRSGIDRVVNAIRVSPTWDVMQEEEGDDEINAVDDDSVQDHGQKGRITWKLVGSTMSAIEAAPLVAGWAYQTFRRHGRPYDLLELQTGRLGWTLSPGDTVEVTLATVPTLTGTRGLTSRPCVVLQVAHTWATPDGGTGPVGSTVLVAVEPEVRRSTYSPSARVSSYDAGTRTLTCSTSYLPDGEGLHDHFEVGDRVIVFNEGDVSTRDARTIESVTAATIVLTVALANCTPTATDTVVIADDYDTSTAFQQAHAYLADTGYTIGAGGDEAFKYV